MTILQVGSKKVVVECGPLGCATALSQAYLMHQRHVDLTQPQVTRMVLGPKKAYLLWLPFFLLLAVIGSVMLLGDFAGAVGIFFVFPFLILLAYYLGIPRWSFCRKTDTLTCRRLGPRRVLAAKQILAVQVCFGGIYYTPGEDGTPYPTYQLNLVLDHPEGSRLNLTHHSDREWTRQAGHQLAGFLQIPLIDHRFDEEKKGD